MPEGVGDLGVALSPEGVRERVQHLGAGVEGALPERVHVVGGDVEHDRGAAHAERGEHARFRKLVGHHHGRVAEGELHGHQLSARQRDAAALLGAQRLRVPGRRAIGVADNDVRGDVHGRIRWLSPNSCQR